MLFATALNDKRVFEIVREWESNDNPSIEIKEKM